MNSIEDLVERYTTKYGLSPDMQHMLADFEQEKDKLIQQASQPQNNINIPRNRRDEYPYVDVTNLEEFLHAANPTLFKYKVEYVDPEVASGMTLEATRLFSSCTEAVPVNLTDIERANFTTTIISMAEDIFKCIENAPVFDNFRISKNNTILPDTNFMVVMENLILAVLKECGNEIREEGIEELVPMIMVIQYLIAQYGCNLQLEGLPELIIAAIHISQRINTYHFSRIFNSISEQIRKFLLNTLGWKYLFDKQVPLKLHTLFCQLKIKEFQSASTISLFLHSTNKFQASHQNPVTTYEHYTELTENLIYTKYPVDSDDFHFSPKERNVYSKKLDAWFKTIKKIISNKREYKEIEAGHKHMRKVIKNLVGRVSELHKIVTVKPIIEGILSSSDYQKDGPEIVKELDNHLRKLTLEPQSKQIAETLLKHTSNRDINMKSTNGYETEVLQFVGNPEDTKFVRSSKETLFQIDRASLTYCNKCDFKHQEETVCYPKPNKNNISRWSKPLVKDFFQNTPETMYKVYYKKFYKPTSAKQNKTPDNLSTTNDAGSHNG